MKYNAMRVTFWFNEIDNFKELQNILDAELNKYFSPFNLTGVPSNFDPIIPRINSNTLGGHTIFNMSKINAQISTSFDNDYVNNLTKCYEYVKQKAEEILNVLTQKCNINILYSAIQVNCEYEEKNPVEKILNNIFNKDSDENYAEIGARFSKKIDDKYYYNISINDAKVVSFTKKIEQGSKSQTIIIPLIPEREVTVEKTVLAFVVEINDKYSYNQIGDYNTTKENFDNIFKICSEKMDELSKNVIEGKII